MNYLNLANENKEFTIAMRRYLHENPEVSNFEENTIHYIMTELDKLGIYHFEVKNGGILAYITGTSKENAKTVLLRADLDALPVQESKTNLTKEKKYLSKITGVSHVCGHDAHTAMLLTTAKILQENTDSFSGRVILMFERGEEGTENVYYLLKYLLSKQERIDGCFTLHMGPKVNSGQLAISSDNVMAGICAFKIKIKGSGGHGSRPDLSNNPVDCFAAIYNALSNYRLKQVSPFDTFTYTICELSASQQINTIPEEMNFGGTARFYETEKVGSKFKDQLYHMCQNIAQAYHCQVEYPLFIGPTAALKNQPQCAALAKESISKVLGAKNVVNHEPLMCTESMSDVHLFYPGVYCLLGTYNPAAGTGADLHEPTFDVDEDVLPLGIAAELAYVKDFLESNNAIDFQPTTKDLDEIFAKNLDS